MSSGGRRENSGRPSPWNNKLTTAIRVPTILAEALLKHAHQLDDGDIFDSVETYKLTKIEELVERYQASAKSTRDFTVSNRLLKELQNILLENTD